MAGSRIAEAISPLLGIFDELKIPYFAGGSIASSIHGIARFTQDVDLIADLKSAQIEILASKLASRFYADTEQMRDALHHGRSFNVIHFDTGFKIDIFPLPQDTFHIGELTRAENQTWKVDAQTDLEIQVASAEDTVLEKLAWYKRGGGISDRQWNDVLGIAASRALDREYMHRYAPQLGIADLLEKLLREADQVP